MNGRTQLQASLSATVVGIGIAILAMSVGTSPVYSQARGTPKKKQDGDPKKGKAPAKGRPRGSKKTKQPPAEAKATKDEKKSPKDQQLTPELQKRLDEALKKQGQQWKNKAQQRDPRHGVPGSL